MDEAPKTNDSIFKKMVAEKARKAAKSNINPATTIKATKAAERRREEIEAKRKADEDLKKEDRKRANAAKRIKNQIQAMVQVENEKDTIEKKTWEEERLRAAEAKKREELETKRSLKEWVKKGWAQPSLIQRFNDSKQKQNALKGGNLMGKVQAMMKTKEILQNAGVNPNEVLTQSQKDDLADAEYISKNAK